MEKLFEPFSREVWKTYIFDPESSLMPRVLFVCRILLCNNMAFIDVYPDANDNEWNVLSKTYIIDN